MKRRVTSILLMLTMAATIALSGCSGDKEKQESAPENKLSGKPVEGGSIKVGIFVAFCIVRSLPLEILTWIIIVVMLYTAVMFFKDAVKKTE